MRIGLLGGSFDPVHLAHVALARTALNDLKLDQVQFLPAKQPWQKPTLHASAAHRLAMIELALANEPNITINPMELERPGNTYTIDTLEALPPTNQYFWLLGADQLQNFPTWHRWQDVASLVTLVAAQRPGTKLVVPAPLKQQIDLGHARLLTLDLEPMDISSSQLRHTLGGATAVHQWLAPAVSSYITEHALYSDRTAPTPTRLE
jgi:nicotinate-nucleotide adenylyltransferase